MSDEKRPGGLTALAVLNFINGGFCALVAAGFILAVAVVLSDSEATTEGQRQLVEQWRGRLNTLLGLVGLYVATTALLIASGIGYLKQKKFLGRTLGTTYSILSIAGTAVVTTQLPEAESGGNGLVTLIVLIYPLLTLALLNTVFKHDFTR